jgi:hypothetical protein
LEFAFWITLKAPAFSPVQPLAIPKMKPMKGHRFPDTANIQDYTLIIQTKPLQKGVTAML